MKLRLSVLLPGGDRTLRFAVAVLVLAFLAVWPSMVRAQEERPDTSGAPTVIPDENPPAVQSGDTVSTTFQSTKSPGLAMLLSAVLPGAGQFYNESYWKVPVVLGFGIYFISNWLDNNRRYIDYRDKYRASLVENPSRGDPSMLRIREDFKDQRDAFTWYFVIMYFINLADAYVDASLYDFNVGSDLSLRRLPVLSPAAPPVFQLTVRFRF